MDKLTEWDLAQIRIGNKKAPEPEEKPEEIIYDTRAREGKPRDIGAASMAELDEMDDDDADDRRAMEALRARRLAALRAEVESARFGALRDITQDEYMDEVSRYDGWVVLHLYQRELPQCKLVNQHLAVLAGRFPATKMLSILSTACIPGYPNANLPTIFVYNKKEIVLQLVTLRQLHGAETTADDLEWALKRVGAVQSDMEEDPRADEEQYGRKASAYIGVRPRDIDDEDD
eukprot:c20981_g1_i1.p1 GENE.c20981_g1_i1~~c20981_g1_i1.p1  ORF type:complete len:242 (-),score=58.95 c20981_g1_i1:236-931(-)